MSNQQSSYRQIFKATSLFGGVQIFNILVSIAKSKFIAVFLGTTGIGIMSLFQSTLDIIASLTNMGLSSSAIRDLSEAHDTGDNDRIRRVVTTFRRWLWITGILGSILTFLISPWLSKWCFNNKDFTLSFALLSVTLFMNALSSGQITLLQGMRKMKHMAQSSIIGATIGLFISLPIYYFFGIKGIVPTFILSSAWGLILTYYFSKKLNIKNIDIKYRYTFIEGIGMVKMGILITVSGFLSMLVAYLVNIFITRTGSISDFGLYQAGSNITNKYVGLVFTAMIIDYYPRLSGVNNNDEKVKEVVNQQTELTVLILAPIIILLLSTTPIVIKLLYTNEFLPIVIFVQWMALSIIFKAISWTLSFILLAKGESKIYFIKEFAMNLILLTCNILGYYTMGLEGLAISFIIAFILTSVMIYLIVKMKYKFSFTKEFYSLLFKQTFLCLFAFLFAYFLKFPIGYVSGVLLFCISLYISFSEMEKRMNLKEVIKTKILKKKE